MIPPSLTRTSGGWWSLSSAIWSRAPRGSAHLYGAIARGNALTRADVARWAPDALAEVFH